MDPTFSISRAKFKIIVDNFVIFTYLVFVELIAVLFQLNLAQYKHVQQLYTTLYRFSINSSRITGTNAEKKHITE